MVAGKRSRGTPRQRWEKDITDTVVPALGDPRRERPPAVYGQVINVPTYFNVPIHPSDERPPAMYGDFCLVPRVSVHDRYYCILGHTMTAASRVSGDRHRFRKHIWAATS